MNLVWWLILPIIYILTWITSWRASTPIEVFLLILLFLIPLLVSWLGEEQRPRNMQERLILFYDHLIETGILLLVSVVPWILDTRANDAIFIKTVFVQIIVFTIATVWFWKCIEEGKFKLPRLPSALAVLVFWWWCVITFITSPYKYASIEEFYRFVSYFLIFFVVVTNIKERAQVFRIITTFMITSGIVGIYGIFQHYGMDFVSWASQARIPSSLGNPDFFSGYLCIVTPIATGLIFASRSLLGKVIYAILVFILLICLFWTKTRGGWAAIPVGIIFFIWLKLKTMGFRNFLSNRRLVRLSLIALGILGAGIALLWFHPSLSDYKYRAITTFNFGPNLLKEAKYFIFYVKPYPESVPASWIEDFGNRKLLHENGIYRSIIEGTGGVRVTIWTGCWRMFLESPFTMIFGQGLGTLQQAFPPHRPPYYRFKTVSHNTRHAHCEYFEILAEQGGVGLVLFLWFIFLFFQKRMGPLHTPDRWKQNLLYGLLTGAFAYLFENLGSVNLRWTSSAPLFWLIAGITVVAARLPDQTQESSVAGIIETRKPGQKPQPQEKKKLHQPVQEKRKVPPEIKALAYTGAILLLIFFYVQITYPFLADIYLRNGVLCRDSPEEWDTAISYYKKALKYEPTNIEVPYKMAYIYAQRKEWIEALKTYLGITRLAPNYTQIHYNLGITYYNLGRIDLAIPEFEKTVKLDWSNSVAFFMLGVCYSAKKEFQKALEAFEKAVISRRCSGILQLDDNPQIYYPAAHLNMGNIYYRLGRIPEAITQYETVLKLEPANQDALTRLQWIREGRVVKWE